MRRGGLGWCKRSIALSVALASPLSVAAQTLQIAPPPGFQSRDIAEQTIVDVYVNDRLVAAASARFDRETIAFDEPGVLARLLPNLTDETMVAAALSQPLAANADRACGTVNSLGACGYVHAQVVAAIFDEARFRVDLSINPAYTTVVDPRAKRLPPPTIAPGIVSSLNSRSVYDFDRQQVVSAQTLKAIAGSGRWAIRGEAVSDLNRQSALRSLFSTYAGQDRALSFGLMPDQSGGTLAQTERLLGLRLRTSSDTRLDCARLGASLVEISAAQSAVVEIRRDGEILDVQRVEPGQTMLDTSRLPTGSYEIDLEIREGGVSRSETQYFSSYGGLPALGRPEWSIEAGQAVAFNARPLSDYSSGPLYVSLGRHQRIGRYWALRADTVLGEGISHVEIGLGIEHQVLTGGVGAVQ